MVHRKLFLSPQNSIDCIYFCDHSCPNYPCLPFPTINFSACITPPPPPSPHPNVSPFIIALISILSIIFVMACCCALFTNDPSNDLNSPTDNNPNAHPHPDEEHHLNENLSPLGLQPGLIKSISAYKYKKSDGLIHGSDCSVCLCEFEEDQSLRKLPKCSHAFHINCIDAWLSSHANCPLCRSPIASISTPNTDPADPNVSNSSGSEEIQMRISEVSDDVP